MHIGVMPITQDGRELIDTLWNVNLVYNKLSVNVVFRINRYIMECKYSYN